MLRTPVCLACADAEEADYETVRKVLQDHPGLRVAELASLSAVDADCILRMMGQGLVDYTNVTDDATCGRCGAPAISHSKRLCERCLAQLEQECAEAMHDMRERLRRAASSEMHDVQETVAEKGADRASQRRALSPPAGNPSETQRRMVYQERLLGAQKKPGR